MLQTQPEVHRGGTVYFPPYLQQPSTRSPARRQKVAIPIVDPLVRVGICHLFVCFVIFVHNIRNTPEPLVIWCIVTRWNAYKVVIY